MNLNPYKHDCDNCIWVGWVYMDDRYGNMYFCPKSEGYGSVVVRFSDRIDDYWSSPVGCAYKGSLNIGNTTTSKEMLDMADGCLNLVKEWCESHGEDMSGTPPMAYPEACQTVLTKALCNDDKVKKAREANPEEVVKQNTGSITHTLMKIEENEDEGVDQ